MILPDGTRVIHDGYFFAADRGSKIKGRHVDVFCGVTVANCFPSFIHSNEHQRFKAVVISDAHVLEFLLGLHTLAKTQ